MDHGHVFVFVSLYLLLYIQHGQRTRISAHTGTPTIDTTVISPLLHRPTTLLRIYLEPTGAPVRLTAGWRPPRLSTLELLVAGYKCRVHHHSLGMTRSTSVRHAHRAYIAFLNAHSGFLSVAIQLALLGCGPVELVLGATEEYRKSLPLSKKIWGHSVNALADRNNLNTMVLQLGERLRKDLAVGKIKREDHIPSDYVSRAK